MDPKRTRQIFITILGLTFICLIVNLPSELKVAGKVFRRPDFHFRLGPLEFKPNLNLRLGLDLSGGIALTYNVNASKLTSDELPSALESLKSNIERRVNLFGVSESSVQLIKEQNSHRLKIEIPGLTNVSEASELIGQTAQLSFRSLIELPPEATASAKPEDYFKDAGITGSHLKRATAQINPQNGQPEVSIEFNAQGTKLFTTATRDNLQKPIYIFLDDYPITAPVVQEVITDGRASISGNFTLDTAKSLAIQLNAGALPLPIELISQNQIGATLGRDTIQKGVFAGAVGLALVSFFMIGNYGVLGIISAVSLVIYGLITLTLYRLIPITLTFPGIVGFILSIGMALDSNILIFARFKEELRAGHDWNQSLELAFGRAWDSIKDANAATIITGLVLLNPLGWNFLNTSGMVRGFALTLILGIAVGIFTGVVVSRNLLRVFTRRRL